jgi:hypothetical protein
MEPHLDQNLHLLMSNCIADKRTTHPKNCFLTPIINEVLYSIPFSLYSNLVILWLEVCNLECREAFDIHIKGMVAK